LVIYPSCVLPIPGAPQNSVIFPMGTPRPPSIWSMASHEVDIGHNLRSCCSASEAEIDIILSVIIYIFFQYLYL
jgi:hypothetical protein